MFLNGAASVPALALQALTPVAQKRAKDSNPNSTRAIGEVAARRSQPFNGIHRGEAMELPNVYHRYVEIEGVRVFYREAGPREAPTLLLLHGFPSSSAQYRRLMDALGMRYRVIAPDYPGFGYSEAPLPASAGGQYAYSFDQLARTIAGFCDALDLQKYFLFMFDFGGPVGMRLALAHPERIAGLVVQNANAYYEGLSEIARTFVALRPGVPGAVEQAQSMLTLEMTRSQYEGGAHDVARIAPDGWTLDQHFLDQPGRKAIQVDLLLDYHNNVAQYTEWQAWLRRHRPPTLVLWGRNDPFFIEAGAHAYLRDLPDAELHLFETGHFALEEEAPRIAVLIAAFLERHSSTMAPKTMHGDGSTPPRQPK
jgi:pimeloyl-ACP methyl ester carboxylesterase